MENDSLNKIYQNERTPRRAFVFWLPVVFLAAIDQITKHWAFMGKLYFSYEVFGLEIRNAIFRNYFFAFSIRLPEWVIFFVYGVALFCICRYLVDHYQHLSKKDFVAWVLIVAGALSNIGERLVLGYVRDFVYIASGIFNVADFYILLGVLLLIIGKAKIQKP